MKETIKPILKILDTWLPIRILQQHIPGMTVCISNGDQVLYENGFGLSSIECGRPMKAGTLFRVASMSKMFTAISILQLIEQNKIKLNTKVSKIIPEFDTNELCLITIRDLLLHRSGVFRDSAKDYWNQNCFTEDVVADICKETFVFERDEHFKYSNFGFAILGKIIEKVSGQKYTDYVTSSIIKKLDLRNTFPEYDESLESRIATGYSLNVEGEERYAFEHSKTGEYASATGFVSNAHDISIFLQAVVARHSKILSKESQELFFGSFKKTKGKDKYGFGFEFENIEGMGAIGHGGGYNGYITRALIIPEQKLSVVVCTNCLGGNPQDVVVIIFKIINWISSLKKSQKKVSNIFQYEGLYRERWGRTALIEAKGNLIAFYPLFSNPFSAKTYLRPVSSEKFVIESSNHFGSFGEPVTFTDIKNGKAHTMIWAGTFSKRSE